MKKLSLYMAAALALFGAAACSDDKDPVLQTPSEFVLNVPAMQDQFIDLEKTGAVELVCSQPNYGYSAVANYSAQVSLTEDFTDFRDLSPKVATLARMSINSGDIATAICELKGLEDEDSYAAAYPTGEMPYEKVFFRAVCELNGVEGSRIESNVVSYNNMKGYFAVATPGYIYLVGTPEGWAGPTESNAAHYADWRLFEPANGIGSKIYVGTFDIPAAPTFRFYTALTGWDADSYGTQVDDNPIEYPEFDGSSAMPLPMVKGKGSFSFPNWPGGQMTITVNMADMNNILVTFTPGAGGAVVIPRYIYMLGSAEGWDSPSTENAGKFENWRLVDNSESGIYTGTFDIPAGDFMFRFALELNDDGWDNTTQIGYAANDGDNGNISLTDNVFNGPYVSGKGNWNLPGFAGGKVKITVNTNDQTIQVVAGE